MATDPVPWMIENGAVHSTNVVRNVSYAVFGGVEGIVTSKALEVRELATPGTSVRVFPGTAAIENRAAGIQDEMYVARAPSETAVAIAATGAAARTDMIVAQIENPWLAGEPWPDPPSNANGPYFFLRVISNVPSTAKTLADAGVSGRSAIPLARINIPANTGTITQAMITDLRTMARPRAEEVVVQSAAITGDMRVPPPYTWTDFGGSWSVAIPKWATSVIVSGWIESMINEGSRGAYGELRANLVNAGVTMSTRFDENNPSVPLGDYQRVTKNIGGRIAVPASIRGTTQTFKTQGEVYADSPNDSLVLDSASSTMFRLRFEETPGSNL